MDKWKEWIWPAIGLLAVAWAGAAIISFIVADSQSSDDGVSESALVVRIDTAVEWVTCQANLTQGIAAGRTLTTEESVRVRNECGIDSDAWVLCADDEISKLSKQELSAFGSSDAVQLAELCGERVGEVVEP